MCSLAAVAASLVAVAAIVVAVACAVVVNVHSCERPLRAHLAVAQHHLSLLTDAVG